MYHLRCKFIAPNAACSGIPNEESHFEMRTQSDAVSPGHHAWSSFQFRQGRLDFTVCTALPRRLHLNDRRNRCLSLDPTQAMPWSSFNVSFRPTLELSLDSPRDLATTNASTLVSIVHTLRCSTRTNDSLLLRSFCPRQYLRSFYYTPSLNLL